MIKQEQQEKNYRKQRGGIIVTVKRRVKHSRKNVQRNAGHKSIKRRQRK